MSINFCTLTNASVDTFCGSRRQIVLDNLLTRRYTPTLGTNNSSVRDTFAQQRPDLIRHVEPDDRPTLTFEQPLITVQVTLGGITMQHTLESQQRLDFVTVTDLEIRPVGPEQVTVNIADIHVSTA